VKTTSQTLAEKIAGFITGLDNTSYDAQVLAEKILKDIPELTGFDVLADQLETCWSAAHLALHDPTRYRARVTDALDTCAEAYQQVVGEMPLASSAETVEAEDDTDDTNDGELAEEVQEHIELAPDESEQ
jgi:hypothetical protein